MKLFRNTNSLGKLERRVLEIRQDHARAAGEPHKAPVFSEPLFQAPAPINLGIFDRYPYEKEPNLSRKQKITNEGEIIKYSVREKIDAGFEPGKSLDDYAQKVLLSSLTDYLMPSYVSPQIEERVIKTSFDHVMDPQNRQLYLAMALAEAALDGVTINLVADQYVSNVVSKKEAA